MNGYLCHRFCLTLIAVVFSFSALFAGSDVTLPAKFKRVSNLSEINDEGIYLIGGVDLMKKCFLMSGLSSPKDKNFRGAYEIEAFNQILTVETPSCLWQIRVGSDGNSFYLRNNADDKYVNTSDKSETYLLSESSRKTKWWIENAGDSKFLIKSDTASDRKIAAYYSGQKKGTRFGNYINADRPGLYIYKLVTNVAEIPGEAALPENGATVSIYADGLLAESDFKSMLNSDGFLLSDSKVAYDETLALPVCSHSSDGCFSLSMGSGLYLGHDLKPTTVENLWKISEGHIVTCEETPQMLVVRDGALSLIPDGKIGEGISFPVFMTAGTKPNLTRKDDGIVCLEGAWSARKLKEIDWTGTTGLDLSGISLPLSCGGFENYPEQTNALIFVDADDASLVPTGWPLAVACSSVGNDFIHKNNRLADGLPFYTDRDINVEQGQLTYTREAYADGYWETLCLPFDAALPSGFFAETMAASEGDTYYFQQAKSIGKDEPIIMRYVGEGQDDLEIVDFEAVSTKCEISNNAVSTTTSVFLGTYSPIEVESISEGLFFLNSKGDTFVLADVGSNLKPFRAYLKDEDISGSAKSIRHSTTSGIKSTESGDREYCVGFDLSGRKIDTSILAKPSGRLPSGMYIINGKKIIK